ncbi:hypothetical protein APTSU1_000059600 [Apodemus speciosus]|uniref:Uncharacterized protein n=1 Tax=Apodemus speciosus TaxID=105296 RepID=A0ABQ0EEL3_APOSI
MWTFHEDRRGSPLAHHRLASQLHAILAGMERPVAII